MDSHLLEQLLNESESPYLDFKREQYKFKNASDYEKSEILKDILAFTNAWRRTDAYILIGVDELKGGGKSTVVGIDKHLDDHSLQQFVNQKTQEPITFSYITYDYYNKQIGIVWVPVQKRPIYLLKKYGNLKGNTVYVRRGSSTAIATPDEIAKMGVAKFSEMSQPSLDLQLADIQNRTFVGHSTSIESTVLRIPNQNNIPDFAPSRQRSSISSYGNEPIKSYYRNLVKYCEAKLLIRPIGFVVRNLSQVMAQNVRMVVTSSVQPNIKVFEEATLPNEPSAYINFSVPMGFSEVNNSLANIHNDLDLSFHGNNWTLEINFGNIQPKAESWSNDVIFIGSFEDNSFALNSKLFADNLPNPIDIPLTISFSTTIYQSTIEELENWVKEERMKHYNQILDDEY